MVEETQLASPDQPGQVIAAAQETRRVEYDEHGRAEREVAVNLRSPDLVTQMRYDAAGRVVGVKVGDAGEQMRGFDVASRVVLETDGTRR